MKERSETRLETTPGIKVTSPFGLSLVIAVPLLLAGVLVPSSSLIESLRPMPPGGRESLLLGAALFKIGLIAIGLSVAALGRLPIWQSALATDRQAAGARRSTPIALGLILIAAAALRFYRLDSGLWHDEILTYVSYVRLPFGQMISTYVDQNQHFLFSILARLSFDLFGESAWALRLPAVLFGIGSIAALYLFGRTVASEREALFSAALLTVSYHHVWFSQNARGYTGLLFWTLLSSWLLVRGCRGEQARAWPLYAVTVALGVYTHLTMAFVVAAQFMVYATMILTRRQQMGAHPWAGLFLGFGLAGLLAFQLHALVLPQVFSAVHGEESTIHAWKHPLWTLLEFVKAVKIGFAGGAAGAAAALVLVLGMASFARTDPIVNYLFILPAALCAAIIIGLGHHLWPRFFFFAFGFAALIAVRGTMRLGDALARALRVPAERSAILGTVLCAGLLLSSALSLPRAYGPKQDYLGARSFVEASRRSGDSVVTVGLVSYAYKNFYQTRWEAVEDLEELNAVRSRAKRTWLLYTFPPHIQSVYPGIMGAIEKDFKVVKAFPGTLGNGTIFVCLSDVRPS